MKQKKNNLKNIVNIKKEDVWENEEFSVLDSIPFFIPIDIQLTLLALNEEFNDTEFSIFGKAIWNPDDNGYNMSSEIFIPKQKVSAGSIDITEDSMDYNVVIHKHPDGCKSFSSIDDTYINSNFEFSLLWESKKFCKATGKIWVNQFNSFMRSNIDPVIYGLSDYLPTDYKNIEKLKYKSPMNYGLGGEMYRNGYNSNFIESPISAFEPESIVKPSFSKKEIQEITELGYSLDEDGDIIDKDGYIVSTMDDFKTIMDACSDKKSIVSELSKTSIHSIPISQDLKSLND